MQSDDTYDYVIVGSGAAGSVVAARLGDAGGASICVLEAGGHDRHPLVKIPAGFVKNLTNPNLMWQFRSTPGENTGGRGIYLPQGKLLGGSTSINGLIYNRGQPGDFDAWSDAGNDGWSYQQVLPYFRRSESRQQISSPEMEPPDEQYRGSFGPLRISDPDQHHAVCDAFIDAVAQTGVPKHNDYNARAQRGTGYYQRFIYNGRRESVASAYLTPAMRRGSVDVHTQSRALRLIVEAGKATGVEVEHNGIKTIVHARREVIVSAGTINSARLLQLSGIGDGEKLQSLGIPVTHHLPGVGNNLQDHYFVRLAVRLRAGTSTLNQQSKGLRLGWQVLRWCMRKPSILSWSPSIAYAFLNSTDFAATPDLQFVFSHGSYRPGKVYELDSFPAATCGFTQQRPESRGYVHILSSDPDAAPEVQPNYLATKLDQDTAVRGIRLARQFLQSESLQPWFEREEVPGAALENDAELLDYARNTGNTGYHLVGTCKMGPGTDTGSVVNADLQVHGLQSLRVIDASVMPSVTSSNTCAATIMIAEKGAELVQSGSGSN